MVSLSLISLSKLSELMNTQMQSFSKHSTIVNVNNYLSILDPYVSPANMILAEAEEVYSSTAVNFPNLSDLLHHLSFDPLLILSW